MAQLAENSETDVANRALSHIRKDKISSIDDDTGDTADHVRLHFGAVRDALLRTYPWNFAKERARLAASGDKPLFGWSYYYDLPEDCLWVREVVGCAANGWEVENGRRIATNLAPPLSIVYTKRVTEPPLWDALFNTTFSMHLAVAIAPFLSADEGTTVRVANKAASMLSDAFPPDAAEQGDVELPETSWVTCRR